MTRERRSPPSLRWALLPVFVALGGALLGADLLTLDDGTTVRLKIAASGATEVAADGVGPGLKVTQSGSGKVLALLDGSSEVLTVADGGNVGVGTTAPSQKLDVNGTILGSMPLVDVATSSLSSWQGFSSELLRRSMMVAAVPSTGSVYLRFSGAASPSSASSWTAWTSLGSPAPGQRIVGVGVTTSDLSSWQGFSSNLLLGSMVVARMANGTVYLRYSGSTTPSNAASWTPWRSLGNPGF